MTEEEKGLSKGQLRKKIKDQTKLLTDEYCQKADRQIIKKVQALSAYQQAKTVLLFAGSFGEPDTSSLIEAAFKQGKRVCLPRCLDEHTMKAYEIKDVSQLKAGRYGILEPVEICPEVDISQIDFALIPCVTCDNRRNRLGHGKGYYDRYMAEANFISCMVCRRLLMTENVPTEACDIRPDILITDEVDDVR